METIDNRRTVDTVTFEVISSALHSIAEEMGVILKRSSYSPIIRDMDDFSCALFTPDGDLVAQADYIPAQLGAMSLVVKAIIERWDGKINDGDAFICNHPFLGAMHLPDVNVVTPIFVDGRLEGWSGTAAHHIDVGGVNPGSEGPELEDIFAEGLILPPVRLSVAGTENPDVISIITDNIRDPLSTVSDLRAQRAACILGYQRLNELAEQYGMNVLSTVMSRSLDVVEKAVRNSLLDLPDGTGEAEGFLDDDGIDGPPTRIHAKVSKTGDTLTIDLSGSSAQVRGAMNVPWASARAGIVYAVRAVVAPDLGANDGLLRAVNVIAPKGSVLNPEAPAAVSIRHNTCQRFADTLIRALTDLWPDEAVGSSTVSFFCMNVGSTSPVTGRPAVMADVVGGGTGGTRFGDGVDGVDTYMSNVGVMPAEVVETNYRIRILKNEFVPGSQGTGKYNGGMGLRREYQILEHAQRATFYAEQTNGSFSPEGAAGGEAAHPTRITLITPDGTEHEVATKTSTTLQPGTVVRVETAGGGGFGPAAERPAELKAADLRDGRLVLG
ncbi:hydantoinase B/oxoprolinase family protein [Arthrobacter crystallopoietes]|uniref:hydantoinase B/oxoprolinase family protein n=1 Tax=Crystallibacter crystallopoietes TaxID=37928 RepID=UPI0011111F43|nr:hydantoinase B/oxoprolinase family protein [Arthrobacter crystallopoietes]